MSRISTAGRRRLLLSIACFAGVAGLLASAPRAFAAEPAASAAPSSPAAPVPPPSSAAYAAPSSPAAPLAPSSPAAASSATVGPASAATPLPQLSAGSDPAAEQAQNQTHPRKWLTITGAIALGGAYGFNTVIFPLAAIDPPDGTNAGPSAWWYIVPIVGPFVAGAQTTNNNLGFRRVEYIDGAIQVAGVAMIVASYVYPVKTEVHTANVTYQPIISPGLMGMGGTF